MGALLDSGMVGNIGLKHLRVIKEDTIRKWDDLGFLEGLEGHQKDNIAQLYENQASYLINEAAVADASGSFETVVFPIIRRVFSKLLANDIVSVQAMNLPIGKLFYFIPKIQERNELTIGLLTDIQAQVHQQTDTQKDKEVCMIVSTKQTTITTKVCSTTQKVTMQISLLQELLWLLSAVVQKQQV